VYIADALDHFSTKHNIEVNLPEQVLPFLDDYLYAIANTDSKSSIYTSDDLLRQELLQNKLSMILEQQALERRKTSKYNCLFCKMNTTEKEDLFRHMSLEHGFIIGNLDNLVFFEDFLSILRYKLSQIHCLFCEKEFPNHTLLRKHMRKKKHFQVNPRNTRYDRFYISNYTLEKDQDDGDELDGDFEEWDETIHDQKTMCLFDEELFETPEMCVEHMNDFYDRIRFINYTRSKYSNCTCFSCDQSFHDVETLIVHLESANHSYTLPKSESVWNDTCYLFPFYDNDPLLMVDEDQVTDSGDEP
jgi:hypothetical protein